MTRFLMSAAMTLATTTTTSSCLFAATIAIPASQDTYVRSGTASTNYNATGILSARSGGVSTSYRGIFQFDLSAVLDPIVDAHVEFYQMPHAANTSNYSHNAWLLPDTAVLPGIDETVFNYTMFNASGAYNAQLIDTPLGDLSLADASGMSGDGLYRASPTTMDSVVLMILNNRRSSSDPTQRFAFLFTDPSSGTSRLFGDHEGANQLGEIVLVPSQPVLLVLTTVPEPFSWILCGFALLSFGLLQSGRSR